MRKNVKSYDWSKTKVRLAKTLMVLLFFFIFANSSRRPFAVSARSLLTLLIIVIFNSRHTQVYFVKPSLVQPASWPLVVGFIDLYLIIPNTYVLWPLPDIRGKPILVFWFLDYFTCLVYWKYFWFLNFFLL